MERSLLPAPRPVAHVGAAAPAPVHQPVVLQQGDRLPHGLPGHVEPEAQFFFRHQGLPVPEFPFRDLLAQGVRHLQVLGLFRHSKHILSGMLFTFYQTNPYKSISCT